MPRRDDLKPRIRSHRIVEGGQQISFQLLPGGVEALVDEAARADVRGHEGDEGVDGVVLAGRGAAHREDQELVGWVHGEVGGYVAERGAVRDGRQRVRLG